MGIITGQAQFERRSGEQVTPGPRALLLDEQPDLAAHIDPEQWEVARASTTVSVCELPSGPCDPGAAVAGARRPFAALVLQGLLARTIDIGGHPGLELYGPGDVTAASTLRDVGLPVGDSWVATTPVRLAVLDDDFLVATRRWPRLVTGLTALMARQHDRLVLQLVAAEQPRVEDRLLALFRLLSERFGRVCADGVLVELKLTHETLGRLVGARRPTITLALRALRERGALVRRPGGWLIAEAAGEPAPLAQALGVAHGPMPL